MIFKGTGGGGSRFRKLFFFVLTYCPIYGDSRTFFLIDLNLKWLKRKKTWCLVQLSFHILFVFPPILTFLCNTLWLIIVSFEFLTDKVQHRGDTNGKLCLRGVVSIWFWREEVYLKDINFAVTNFGVINFHDDYFLWTFISANCSSKHFVNFKKIITFYDTYFMHTIIYSHFPGFRVLRMFPENLGHSLKTFIFPNWWLEEILQAFISANQANLQKLMYPKINDCKNDDCENRWL